MFEKEFITNPTKLKAVDLFHEAYSAQIEKNYDDAIELYHKSIETFPTAEAYTFLGWTYSFKGDYDRAIAECLGAIAVDSTFGNPYNDIGSYFIAKGNYYDCIRWFNMAIKAIRYEARAYPHYNLGTVYERTGKLLDAMKHYTKAVELQPDYACAYKALRRLQQQLN